MPTSARSFFLLKGGLVKNGIHADDDSLSPLFFAAAIEVPEFDTPHLDNHTVQLGATAFLPCTIKNLGNKSVGSKLLIIYLA